jgi:phosphomannomutase
MFLDIGASAAVFLREKGLASPHFFVGYDVRTTSSMFAYALAAGMTSVGATVTFAGEPFPFGVVLYSGLALKVDVTAFVTASHLPADWNGVKFYYADGVGFSEEDNIVIRDIYLAQKFLGYTNKISWADCGFISSKHAKNSYYDFLKARFTPDRKLKVIIDCGNGSASLSAPEIFERCSYHVFPLWCDVDPTFPNRSPEPDEQSLTVLCQKVVEHKADFGVGFDADGDRAVIVADTGHVLLPEHVGTIIANYLISLKPKAASSAQKPVVLANVECSSAIDENLKNIATIQRVKVGHTYLTLEAKKTNAIIGMESSGHFVFPDYYLFDDAILTPLLIGKCLTSQTKKLSEIVETLPIIYKAKATVPVSDTAKFKVIGNLTKILATNYSIDTIDGIGIQLDQGRILLRASNTSPMIRLTVEAKTHDLSRQLLEKFTTILAEEVKKLS